MAYSSQVLLLFSLCLTFSLLFATTTAWELSGGRKNAKVISRDPAMSFQVNSSIDRQYSLQILQPTVGSTVNAFSVDFRSCKPRKDRTVVCVPMLGDEGVSDILWLKVWASLTLFSVSSDGWWLHLDFDAFPKAAAYNIKLLTSQLTAQRDPVYEVNSGVYFAYVRDGTNKILEEWASFKDTEYQWRDKFYNISEQDSLNEVRARDIRKVRTVPDGYLAYHTYGGDSKSKEKLVNDLSDWASFRFALPEVLVITLWLASMARSAPGLLLLVRGKAKVSTFPFSRDELLRKLHMLIFLYLCLISVVRASIYALGSTKFDYTDSFFDYGVADFFDTHRRYFLNERGACTVAWNAGMNCINLTRPVNIVIHRLALQMVAADSSGRTTMFKTHLVYNLIFFLVLRRILVPVWEAHCRCYLLGTYDSKGRVGMHKAGTVSTVSNKQGFTELSSKSGDRVVRWQFYWRFRNPNHFDANRP